MAAASVKGWVANESWVVAPLLSPFDFAHGPEPVEGRLGLFRRSAVPEAACGAAVDGVVQSES